MGIRGLYGHIKKIPNSSKQVNIIEEVEKYKRKEKRNPTIVLNLWTLAYHWKSNLEDKLLGYRLNEIQEDFENFLAELKKHEVEMVFLFKKTQYKEHEFIVSQEAQYKTALEMIDVISTTGNLDAVANHFVKIDNFDFPTNMPILTVLTQVAKNYGKLFGMDSIDNKPATYHIHIVIKNQAMAIAGTDTYYIFYGGSWKFWADVTLDIKNMTIQEYDKELILKSIGITVEQAPLFVALVGGLYTDKEDDVKTLTSFFKPFHNIFKNASDFLNKFVFPVTEETLERIVATIYGSHRPQIIEDFRRTLNLMNVNADFNNYDVETSYKSSANDYMNFADLILTKEPILITPIFSDLRSNDIPPLYKLVSLWFQKTAGFLAIEFPETKVVKLLVKENHFAKASSKRFPAIAPSSDVDVSDEMQLLTWLTDTKIPLKTLNSIPREVLIDLIIVTHLMEKKAIKFFEAKMIFQTVLASMIGKELIVTTYPEKISERALRVSFLFSNLYYILHSCLSSVGLNFQTFFRFDNVFFQKQYQEEKSQEIGNEETFTLTEIISVFLSMIDL